MLRSRRPAYLYIMFCKLLRQLPAAFGKGIDGIVDGNLALLVVQEVIQIHAAFLEDRLAQLDRFGRSCKKSASHARRLWAGPTVNEEVVVGDVVAGSHVGAPIIPEVERAGLDSEPGTPSAGSAHSCKWHGPFQIS